MIAITVVRTFVGIVEGHRLVPLAPQSRRCGHIDTHLLLLVLVYACIDLSCGCDATCALPSPSLPFSSLYLAVIAITVVRMFVGIVEGHQLVRLAPNLGSGTTSGSEFFKPSFVLVSLSLSDWLWTQPRVGHFPFLYVVPLVELSFGG